MKVIMYPAITLDGFIADLNGECYSWINEDDEAKYEAEMERCGCAIVGHKTYEQYKEDYPSKKNIVTFVCTHQQSYNDEEKLKFVQGSPAEILEKVSKEGFSEVVLSGGGEINGMFAAAGLVDEIIISIYPVTLGEGINLFGSQKPSLSLELLSTSESVKGIVQNHYRVVK